MRISLASATTTLRHRWPTLLAILASVLFFADGTSELTPFAALLPIMAIIYLIFGAARRDLTPGRELTLQLTALVAFAGIAALVLALAEPLARPVLAAGWLAHGIWDLIHHRRNRVVPRAWSEWCGVVDVLGAAAILLLPH
ncbi:hypothetical protein NDR87_16740 [Nocardia sp. CDC159]|uniref:Uncharacterized protein n=1 Tax=Nocardia pulmonis TaxID=2951408 RepID=A0A9X2EBT4_9NOCA|nr:MULTISPECIES: hypothetical protein [Nocardia]MCM6775258.1 hypothetical protein [Nocardia pulmonis]MCM6788008.1 hypothetical protein [Nocardia sp. CDC159]